MLDGVRLPEWDYTIAALPIIGILLVIGWFGVRKRVAEFHSTAPVVEEDEENRKIVFKLKRRANCKLPGYVPVNLDLLTKVCRMRRDKSQASFSVFTCS
ncbi:hypothetical protein ACVXHB_05285 [Escherichia coli]